MMFGTFFWCLLSLNTFAARWFSVENPVYSMPKPSKDWVASLRVHNEKKFFGLGFWIFFE